MSKFVVGIDSGVNGAIYVLRDGKKYFSTTYPKLPNGELDRLKIFKIFLKLKKMGDVTVIIEKVHAHQKAGGSSNFSFGRAFEVVTLLPMILKIRHILVEPKEWQKIAWQGVSIEYKPTKVKKELVEGKKPRAPRKIVDTKKTSDLASRRLFPDEDYRDNHKPKSRVRHDGLVDASLIAWYGHVKGY